VDEEVSKFGSRGYFLAAVLKLLVEVFQLIFQIFISNALDCLGENFEGLFHQTDLTDNRIQGIS